MSRGSNDFFGASFDGFSAMNKTEDFGKGLDLKNLEFEVSYDFTKEIKRKTQNIRIDNEEKSAHFIRNSLTPSNKYSPQLGKFP